MTTDNGRYVVARQSDTHVRVYCGDREQALDLARANRARGIEVVVTDTHDGSDAEHKNTIVYSTEDGRYAAACSCGWGSSGTFANERTAGLIGATHIRDFMTVSTGEDRAR